MALGYNSATLDANATAAAITGAALSKEVVSVGNATIKRRIQNVADGADDYDAVNVRQIKAVQENIASVIGAGATVDPTTGLITGTDIGGVSGATTVSGAIAEVANKGQENLDTAIANLVSKGMVLDANSGTAYTATLGSTIAVKGAAANTDFTKSDAGKNIYTQVEDDGTIRVALAKELQDLTSVSINNGVDGKDGATVIGKDGISITGPQGANGVDGITVIGKDGISITGPQGANGEPGTTTTITGGTIETETIYLAGKDGKDGTELTSEVIKNLQDTTDKGMIFGANSGTAYQAKLGDTISVKGAAANTDFTKSDAGKNIYTQVESDGTINVALAKNVDLGADGSLTVGNTTVNNDGLVIAGGPSVTSSGIDAAGQVVSNIGRAVNDNDAVNLAQLNEVVELVNNQGGELEEVKDRVTAVENQTATNTSDITDLKNITNQHSTQINNLETITTEHTTQINNLETITTQHTTEIAENKEAITNVKNDVEALSNSTVQYAKNADGSVNKDKIELAGGANGTQITNLASAGDYTLAENSKNAVNAGDLNTAVTNVTNDLTNKGLTFTGDTGSNTAKLGSTVNIKGADANITTAVNGQDISIALSQDLNVNSITAKDVVADNGSIKNINSDNVVVGDVIINKDTGINAGNKAISNVGAGTNPTDAANMQQVTEVAQFLGGGAGYNNITNSFEGPSYEIKGSGTYNDVGSALTAVDGKVDALRSDMTQAFYSTNERIDDVEKKANAGIAAAMALESAPYIPGKYTYAVGAAHHSGENAVGITLRKTADNGRWSITGGVAAASQGDPSFRIGISGVID